MPIPIEKDEMIRNAVDAYLAGFDKTLKDKPKSAQVKSAQTKPAELKPVQPKTSRIKPAAPKSNRLKTAASH